MITRVDDSSVNLAEAGNYLVQFQISTEQGGQLVLTLNGTELPYTVVGTAGVPSQIVGYAIVTTTVSNSVITVRNPAGNTADLTLTPNAGGAEPVSAHLVITRLS